MPNIIDPLLSTHIPALPFAPVAYEQRYHDQLNRILTQYFNQNDNVNNTLLSSGGGRYINFPHVAASYAGDQYASANNTQAIVKWDTLDSNSGFTLNDGSDIAYPANTATAAFSGVYKIDYSLQFANTHNAEETIYVWLKVNNTNYVGSTSKFTIPKQHAGGDGYLVAYSSLAFQVYSGDYVGLYWATSRAASIGGTLGVYMQGEPAQTIGTAPAPTVSIPSTPSSVGTIAFVSSIAA